MPAKGNQEVPHAHFKKHWNRGYAGVANGPRLVKCYFNQPGKKRARYQKRQQKARDIAPMPTAGSLRPAVRCQTNKYNMRMRAGRGFSLAELKAAEISPKWAQTVGIAVDHRRKNRSLEGLQENVQRLVQYKAKLVVLPKKSANTTEQLKGFILPLAKPSLRVKARAATAEEKNGKVFKTMRHERATARMVGIRQKIALEKAAEAAMKKK